MEDVIVYDFSNLESLLSELNNNILNLTELIELHFNNISLGIKFIMYFVAFLFFLKIIHLLYRLFGGVFFGGV